MTQVDAPLLIATVPQSDSALLAEFAEHRRENAFAEVVRRHGGLVLSVCRSVVENTSDAEDAAQAVFLTLAQKAHSAPVREHLVGWLHRVAWYVAARAAKASAIRRRHEQEAARMRQETVSSDQQPVQVSVLHSGIARLPERYRIPVILHHLEGRSQGETARILGCNEGALAVRLHRARRMLRERLDQKGAAVLAAGLAAGWGSSAQAQVAPPFVAKASGAAIAVLAGRSPSAAGVSSQGVALSKQAIRMLLWTKVRTVGIVVATAAMLLLAVGLAGKALVSNAPNSQVASLAPHVATRFTTGVIVQLGDGSISLVQRTKEVIALTFNAATVIKINNVVRNSTDLKLGMGCAVYDEPGQPATEIHAEPIVATQPSQ